MWACLSQWHNVGKHVLFVERVCWLPFHQTLTGCVPFTDCNYYEHKDSVQGDSKPWALSSGKKKTFHTIKPCAWVWTKFHLPIHLRFSLSHGSSALCQCHFTTFYSDIITSVHVVHMALCTLPFLRWMHRAQRAEMHTLIFWSFDLTIIILLCLENN